MDATFPPPPSSRAASSVRGDVQNSDKALLEGIPHLVWQSLDNGIWSAASKQWHGYTGQAEVDSLDRGWQTSIHPDDLSVTEEAWRRAITSGMMAVDHRIRRQDGEFRWFRTRALPVPADATAGPSRRWIGTSTDIDEQRRAEEQVRHLAYHDSLTGLGNRAMLDEALDRFLTAGHERAPFAVLYLDLDDFKLVNDRLGHRGGDSVLRETARRLRDEAGIGAIIARVGGDEFVILGLDDNGAEGATALAGRLARRLGEPMKLGGQELRLTASIGVSTHPADGNDAEALLRCADLAMFEVKDDGGDGVRRFSRSLEEAWQNRLFLRTGLEGALERGELSLAYQPIRDARTGSAHGWEALARWTHPTRGVISPASFIPVAEESGLIVPLGRALLQRACADAAGSPGLPGVLAVNLSPVQFRSGTLPRDVAAVLERTGLSPGRLELEVTERLMMGGEAMEGTLSELKALGVRIALDDFGTGHSNLAYLCRFPFDRLKIDQSFVRRLSIDADARTLVAAIVTLAHSLRLLVTAEGVETASQLAMLRDMGCDQVQGFLLGRPSAFAAVGLAGDEGKA